MMNQDRTVCRKCDSALWRTPHHRGHRCRTKGCACPVCVPAPLAEIRAVLDAIDGVLAAASRQVPIPA